MSATAAAMVPAHGSGSPSRSRSCRPPGPNRSLVGHGRPNASSVACTRFLSATRWRTRCSRHRARSRSARTCGSGSQIAGTSSRRDSSARTQASIQSVLQASGAKPLTFWASAIWTSQPASSSWSWTNRAPFIDPGRRHHRLPQPRRLTGQPMQPVRIWRCRGDQHPLTCLVHHMHIQPVARQVQPCVQHGGASSWCSRCDNPEIATRGGPSSWHSVQISHGGGEGVQSLTSAPPLMTSGNPGRLFGFWDRSSPGLVESWS
jgi:hypothetical protein